ncbi:antitoxin Xre-like helix-turn-helix domain-containing protein [Colwellia sp. MB3u-4]|uniref:antitoxin Xre-like helix-turn-helix domain-containing protein n=1 Tax=Colwellia sp. MB3u-4 TaxID=2759822 RepID=UPI0015F72A61|nr:antitoxin Xre-like helix-turn-helix domain-containing protein [Colwellia sp. MB3u-4]MBA6289248.1 DUF2384 domain-containing protein [Colwellia sp. MB3u-4]
MTQVEDVLAQTPGQTAKVALSTFFNIMTAWKIKVKDQIILLGQPLESTYYNWKKGKAASISRDTLERISLIIGIYKDLRILFPIESQANAWVHKDNERFNGNSAISLMLKGQYTHLIDMRRYLDDQVA